MGSKDRFHRRKSKNKRDLERRKAKRDPYDRVLIVCEGEKTEPNYLQEIIDCLELNTANIEIVGDCASCPLRIVEYAEEKFKREKHQGDSYDKVFCVFDKDTHSAYEDALNKIRTLKPTDTFVVINSVPCFEYWLLLHFKYTTKPFVGTGEKSGCARLIDELCCHIPQYKKNMEGILEVCWGKTELAIDRSIKALDEADNNDTDNPTSLMHELVDYLRKLNNDG